MTLDTLVCPLQSNSANRYIKNYEFDYPQLGARFTVTSVVGHLFGYDFGQQYKNWSSCDPFVLFDAPVEHKVAEVRMTRVSCGPLYADVGTPIRLGQSDCSWKPEEART